MRTALIVTMSILLLPGGIRPAHADFVLESNNPTPEGSPPAPPPGPGSVAPAPGAAVVPGMTTSPPEFSLPASPSRPPRDPNEPINLLRQSSRVPIAHGFGHDVPLSFAVRQIVPARLRVTYANQSDLSALVNWKGGEPWNVVLANAVRPLGDRVWISASSVRIYRPEPGHRQARRAVPLAWKAAAASVAPRTAAELWSMTEEIGPEGLMR
jgi:hypothetical protein